jgi:hypothetical protein
MIIANINGTLRGWFEYLKYSYHTTFPPLDSRIRMFRFDRFSAFSRTWMRAAAGK